MTHEEFMKIVRETNAKNKIPIEDLPIKEQLLRRINSNMKTEEEYFQLKKDIQDYFDSDAPEEDKRKVAGDAECIWMMCSAFEEMWKRGEKWGNNMAFISHRKEFETAAEAQILKGLEECGIVAESYAKDKCHVDTGNLRNSITHKVVLKEHTV